MKAHPAADLFPMMTTEELQALAEDIKENGQIYPIIVTELWNEDETEHETVIVDGRNRYKACEMIGREPWTRPLDSEETIMGHGRDVLSEVISLNAIRRNLTRSQKAVVAASAWEMYEVEQGRPSKESVPRSGTLSGEKTRDRLADQFGVGKNAVQEARRLLLEAPELAEKVRSGEGTLPDALELLRQSREKLEKSEEELRHFERLLAAQRKRLSDLVGQTIDLDLLPAPPEDELVTARETLERAMTTSIGVAPPEPSPDLKRWETTLKKLDAIRGEINSFPEEIVFNDALLVIAARESARLLVDMAARITARLPKPEARTQLREVGK